MSRPLPSSILALIERSDVHSASSVFVPYSFSLLLQFLHFSSSDFSRSHAAAACCNFSTRSGSERNWSRVAVDSCSFGVCSVSVLNRSLSRTAWFLSRVAWSRSLWVFCYSVVLLKPVFLAKSNPLRPLSVLHDNHLVGFDLRFHYQHHFPC